jgi:tRNA (cytidine56-2'-O)-methyltransferase
MTCLVRVMRVHVLRLGHRPVRDKRVTTHLMLAARAFGALGASYTGIRDYSLEESVRQVASDWGGDFSIEYAERWKSVIDERRGIGRVVHLTMYGLPIQDVLEEIREIELDMLIVVGGMKVPGEIYDIADWNVAVTSQPHSEVSALAVFLHELFEGRELRAVYGDARLRVVPKTRGKSVEGLLTDGLNI